MVGKWDGNLQKQQPVPHFLTMLELKGYQSLQAAYTDLVSASHCLHTMAFRKVVLAVSAFYYPNLKKEVIKNTAGEFYIKLK